MAISLASCLMTAFGWNFCFIRSTCFRLFDRNRIVIVCLTFYVHAATKTVRFGWRGFRYRQPAELQPLTRIEISLGGLTNFNSHGQRHGLVSSPDRYTETTQQDSFNGTLRCIIWKESLTNSDNAMPHRMWKLPLGLHRKLHRADLTWCRPAFTAPPDIWQPASQHKDSQSKAPNQALKCTQSTEITETLFRK